MLEIVSLDEILPNLYMPINEGFESTIFISDYDTIAKIYKPYVPYKILHRKNQILISLDFSTIHEENVIPNIYQLIYTKNGILAGFTMDTIDGQTLDKFCEDLSINDSLSIFEKLQNSIDIVHNTGFCLADFNPDNIIVTKKLNIKFVDVDSFCFINDSTKHKFCNYKYSCPYGRKITKKYNLYSFYLLFINTVLHVNIKDNGRKKVREKILEENSLPKAIKEKLILFTKIWNRWQLEKLDYLF